MSKNYYPKFEIRITSTWKFRATIWEVEDGKPFEVTVGGEKWNEGVGSHLHEAIISKCCQMNSKMAMDITVVEPYKEQYKVGDWVHWTYANNNGIGKISGKTERGRYYILEENYGNKMTVHVSHHSSYLKLATDDDVKAHLLAEAKRRGFVNGVRTTCLIADGRVERVDGGITYLVGDNGIFLMMSVDGREGNQIIYKEGNWAEIVNDELDQCVAEVNGKKYKLTLIK